MCLYRYYYCRLNFKMLNKTKFNCWKNFNGRFIQDGLSKICGTKVFPSNITVSRARAETILLYFNPSPHVMKSLQGGAREKSYLLYTLRYCTKTYCHCGRVKDSRSWVLQQICVFLHSCLGCGMILYFMIHRANRCRRSWDRAELVRILSVTVI